MSPRVHGAIRLGIASLLALLTLLGSVVAVLGLIRSDLVLPRPTPILEDRHGTFLAEGARNGAPLGFWEVDLPLDSPMAQALMAAEDRRFESHLGVDPRSVLRAAWNGLTGFRREGASTLAMQVARMQEPRERTMVNKVVEASTAVFMTLRHGRRRVMNHYLALVPQGNLIHGVGYASRRYFHKPAEDLGLAEAAVLASLARYPGRMNLFSTEGFLLARARARLVLDLMRDQGRIDAEDHESGLRQLAAMSPPWQEIRPPASTHFILRALEVEAQDPAPRYTGPLRTSLDPDIQALVLDQASGAMATLRAHDASNIAAMVLDTATGEILAYLGSENFFDTTYAGAINYARTPRSSGSILKPFLFATGLDRGGMSPATVLADLPFSVVNPQGEYTVANFDDDYLGPMVYRRALANSRNTPSLRVLEAVGIGSFYDDLDRLDLVVHPWGPEVYGYGLAIGGLYVRLEDLARAYGVLATGGGRYNLVWFPFQDRESPSADLARDRVYTPYASRMVMRFLSDTEARYPSFERGTALEYHWPVAVKTGTSQGFRDAWTVAVSSRYLVALWIGNADNRPTNRVAGMVAAEWVHGIMDALHPEERQGIDLAPWPAPEGAQEARICLISGHLAGPDCPATALEHFRADQVPYRVCGVHQRFAVDRRTGALASMDSPAEEVGFRVFAVLPPEYAVWGQRRGFAEAPVATSARAEALAMTLVEPKDGLTLWHDPTMPAAFQTLSLQVLVEPRVPEVQWWINGEPGPLVPWPYEYRLPLSPGSWRIQARLPDGSLATEERRVEVR